MQRRLAAEEWGGIEELRVGIAVHTGPAEYRAGDYFGTVVNRVARLLAAAWGGQLLLTPDAAAATPLPEGASLRDLGVHLLKDLSDPQQVYGLVHPDLPLREFPAIRTLSSRPNNLPRQPTPLVGVTSPHHPLTHSPAHKRISTCPTSSFRVKECANCLCQ